MIDYVVYSTSNSDYQSWQCKLLEYSFKKVNQHGKLIRLCSYNTHNYNREFDTSNIAEIIKLPDYRTRWTEYTNNLDKDYGIVNKTESLKYWLFNYPELKDTDVVLLIDPDMIFSKAINITTTPGTIIGQRWIDIGAADGKPFYTYASHIKDKITDETIFMYPYIATVGDLRKIVNQYINLTYQMRLDNYPHLWEAEMCALIIASLNNNIEVKTLDNLGFCLTWANQDNFISKKFADSVYMFHYPWSILDKNKNTIFNKQDYTPFTIQDNWKRINPNLATSFLERKFLYNLDNYNLKKLIKFYWEDINLIDSLSNYFSENKYLVFKPWPGGFNNIRMSLEIAACIAFLQNRILVLPPEYHMYLLENVNSMSTFFDIKDLGIKTISFKEFNKLYSTKSWEDIEKIAYTLTEDIVNTILTTTEVPSSVLKGREKIIDINDFKEKEVVFFNGNLLGNFYLSLYTNNLPELCKYVARHIHYNKEIFYEAYKAINYLGEYYAIHIRRNDFQYKDLLISPEEIYGNIKEVIPEGSKLYISTDELDKSFFSILQQHYNIFFYDDIKHLIFEDINMDIIGPIEQIICTEAKTFIGNKLSTFSSYIYRLRGYMDHIADKRFLTYHTKCELNKEEEYWWVATWAREYSEVWELIKDITYFNPKSISVNKSNPKKIFVSIASYRDTQLTDTIDSLFINQSGENEIIIGVCMQDTEENYNNFKYKDHPNVKTHFIPYQEAKGVCYARRLLQQEIFQNENYFLQIDSHSRACPNWDKILIKQISKCPSKKAILSTYPNGFDVLDLEQKYFRQNSCPYLKINFIDEQSKIRPTSAGVVPKGEIMLGFWVAAGFIFTKGNWCQEVEYSSDFYFAGEEDHLSVISYIKGWDVYIPDASTIWHDYTDNRIQSPKKYRPLHWEDQPGVKDNLHLLKDLYKNSYGITGERTSEQFLELAKKISRYDEYVEIEVEFDYTKIPESDPSKKIKVIIFAFRNSEGKEIFRPDIFDENIFKRTSNKIKLNIYNHIHENINKAIWFYKYEDDTFGEFLELPIIKYDKKYII